MTGHSLGGDEDAVALLAEADAALHDQAEEESANIFVVVKELREFVKGLDLIEVVFVTVTMCVVAADRLPNNRGTRVTRVVDGFMQPHWKAYDQKLAKMDAFRLDTRVFKVTVWDPKVRSGTRPRFQVGSVFELRKVHGLKFYHDMLQGNLQATDVDSSELIRQYGEFEGVKRARIDTDDEMPRENNGQEEEKEEEPML